MARKTFKPTRGRVLSLIKEKSAAVFAVRRANYTHRRKGVFNAAKYRVFAGRWQRMCGIALTCPVIAKQTLKSVKQLLFWRSAALSFTRFSVVLRFEHLLRVNNTGHIES